MDNDRDMAHRKIEWSSDLATGIEEIDRQHRYFIKILNDLNEAILKNATETSVRSLRFMDRYAHWHFGIEEKYMKLYGYPDLENHMKQHLTFYENTQKFIKKSTEEGIDTGFAFSVHRYLVDWLILHIMGEDRKFADFLKSRGLDLPEEPMPEDIKRHLP